MAATKTIRKKVEPVPAKVAAARALAEMVHRPCVSSGMTFSHEAKDHVNGLLTAFDKATDLELAALAAWFGEATAKE